MPEIKHLLILANSARAGKHCVAGKVATHLGDNNYRVEEQWIRLTDPRNSEGAVPFSSTICRGHGSVRPLDIIEIVLQSNCGNPDHPEDWYFDPEQPWQYRKRAETDIVSQIADNPPAIWHDGIENKSLIAGYVRSMGQNAASLYLIRAPKQFKITYHKEYNSFKGFDRKIRKLEFNHAGKFHECFVTDPTFERRFKLPGEVSQWPELPTALAVAAPDNVFFCLSLTKLTPPDFDRKHYKICATIFEA
jgi:hypothetical protein